MGITIKEIAELAGVHRSTVDKVLHRREGVSDPVRARVQKIIDENHYQVNPIGKALKMQDKKLKVKVILLQVDALPYIKQGMEEMLKNYYTFQIQVDYEEVSHADVKLLCEKMAAAAGEYDGLIISPINAPEIVRVIDRCAEQGVPVVTVNSDIKGSRRLCFIGQDGYKAGKVAGRFMGEFLGGQGTAAILTSGSDNQQSFPFGTREDGFREIISKAYPGIEVLPSISTYEDAQVTYDQTLHLLREYPQLNGIFITCGCVKDAGSAIMKAGRTDLKLISYEEYPEILELMKQDVVTMTLASGLEEQGGEAVQVLLDRLIYDKEPSRRHLYTETRVMVKESL